MAYTNKQLEREQRSPGLVEIVLGVFLSLVLGVTLGAVHLVFRPVEKAPKDPTKAPSHSLLYQPVYFTEGSASSSKGGSWKGKQQAFAAGRAGEISLIEDELNTFIAVTAPPPAQPPKPAPAEPADPKAKTDDKAKSTAPEFIAAELAPGVVNFRVRDGAIQAAFAGNFNVIGVPLSPLVQTRGIFTKGADGFAFVPSELYLGSLPTHKIPGLAGWLFAKAIAAQTGMPEDIKTAWTKLGNITIEGDTLKLTLP
jgi:hypothetical protein